MIQDSLFVITNFYLNNNVMSVEDVSFALNQAIDILNINYLGDFTRDNTEMNYKEAIDDIIDYACVNGLISPPSILEKDVFEARITNCFMPRPSEVNYKFREYSEIDSKKATDYFYQLSVLSSYIKLDRVQKNIKWTTSTEYGNIDCTINLSKPEKDPRDIMAAAKTTGLKYPKCLLCKENVGFTGKPGRSNHRVVPVELNDEIFYMQYSPYVYYDQHAIVLKENHVPMNINQDTFERLLDFVDHFPHYFLGSNAGLPIVGGSILSHEHYQGGMSNMPIEQATSTLIGEVGQVAVKALHWPMATIRLESSERKGLIEAATDLYFFWKEYTNEEVGIYSYTNQPHNTITPMARKHGDLYTLDLVLRNNRTSEQHPLGIFHTHQEHHHIKKENIGIIEVQGLTILPARLKEELKSVEEYVSLNTPLPESCAFHQEWANQIKERYNGENITRFVHDEVSFKTVQILQNASVFKNDQKGLDAYTSFIKEYIDGTNK